MSRSYANYVFMGLMAGTTAISLTLLYKIYKEAEDSSRACEHLLLTSIISYYLRFGDKNKLIKEFEESPFKTERAITDEFKDIVKGLKRYVWELKTTNMTAKETTVLRLNLISLYNRLQTAYYGDWDGVSHYWKDSTES